jgi:hypothetical protein
MVFVNKILPGNFMNIFRTHFICLIFLGMQYITSFAQLNSIQNVMLSPTANNFAYPQSVFVDSPNGNIWVTDFSNNRVLRFDVSMLTAVSQTNSSDYPGTYFLSQNYPNPFNPSTQISFSVKNTGHASLTIYNILGQTIVSLFNEIAVKNRVYSFIFNAKSLSSGIYLYSLHTEYGSEVKKMCLLK